MNNAASAAQNPLLLIAVGVIVASCASGRSFFDGLDNDVTLHLLKATAYKSGMVALRDEARK